MTMQTNVIELVFKLKDQISGPLSQLRSKISGSLAFGAGIIGVTSFAGAMLKMISATRESQDALLKFDLAFKNLGATSGKTREQLLRFSQDASKVTIFDDESITRAQASLLKFQSLSGQTFDRARQAAIDLASAMGTDLESAAERVGRALQRPEVGIRQLRAAGILFTAEQEKMIRALVKTGDTAGAAEIVLARLEKQFKGAGDAAAKTLSGALARTKTAFDNLFEGSEEDTKKLTAAVDDLAKVLNSPEVKAGIANLITGMAMLAAGAIKAVAAFSNLGKAIADLGAPQVDTARQAMVKELAAEQEKLRDLQKLSFNTIERHDYKGPEGQSLAEEIRQQKAYIETLKQRIGLLKEIQMTRGNGRRGGDRGVAASEIDVSAITDDMKEIEEVSVKAFKAPQSAMEDFYKSLNEHTQTAAERSGAAFEQIRAELDLLLKDGQISAEVYTKRLKEAAEEGLEEVKVTAQKTIIPAIRAPFDALIESVSSAMERMLNNGKFTWRELGQYLMREILSGSIRKALDALRKALQEAMKSSSSGSGGGWFASAMNFVGSLFGGRAGGGDLPNQWTKVGENGAEWVRAPGARVYNQNQMLGMGMGRGAVIKGGDININVEGSMDERLAASMAAMLETRLARQSRETLLLLERNGLRRPR